MKGTQKIVIIWKIKRRFLYDFELEPIQKKKKQ